MAVKPTPDGYHTAAPYLVVNNASEAIEFYKQSIRPRSQYALRLRMERSAMPKSGSVIHRSCLPTSIRRWAFAGHDPLVDRQWAFTLTQKR